MSTKKRSQYTEKARQEHIDNMVKAAESLAENSMFDLLKETVQSPSCKKLNVDHLQAAAVYASLVRLVVKKLETEDSIILQGLVRIMKEKTNQSMNFNHKGELKSLEKVKIKAILDRGLVKKFSSSRIIEEDVLNKLQEVGLSKEDFKKEEPRKPKF